MPYIVALVLVAMFTVNVTASALGNAPAVGNVAEMVILLAAAVAFSVGILRSEAREKTRKEANETDPAEGPSINTDMR